MKKKPAWLDEFVTFAVKGNAMALAVGTIIGGAFSTITKSLTNDLIMPVVNIFMGGADFSEAKIRLPRMPRLLWKLWKFCCSVMCIDYR